MIDLAGVSQFYFSLYTCHTMHKDYTCVLHVGEGRKSQERIGKKITC